MDITTTTNISNLAAKGFTIGVDGLVVSATGAGAAVATGAAEVGAGITLAVSGGKNFDEDIEEVNKAQKKSEMTKKETEPIIKNIHGEERNIRVHEGRQNKHIPKQNNYENAVRQGKTPSVFYGTAEDAQKLVNEFAGKGQLLSKNPNCERINFGKVIGKFMDINSNETYETTWATIKYSKDGVHIVPSAPNSYYVKEMR